MVAAVAVLAGLSVVVTDSEPAHAAATTYYVDAVAGNDSAAGTSAATAWRSLAKVNGTTFTAGDRIQFKRGQTWTGQLHPLGSGTAAAPITIGVYGSGTARPKIDGSTVAGGLGAGAAVLLSNQQFWTITGLEVVNDSGVDNFGSSTVNGQSRYGILVDNTSDGVLAGITISDNYVHNVNGCFHCADIDAHGNGGILVLARDPGADPYVASNESYRDVRITGNTVEDVGRTGIGFFDLSYFVADWHWVEIAPLSTGVFVHGNTTRRTDSDGIVVFGTEGALMQYNVVRDAGMRTIVGSDIAPSAGLWPTRAMNTIVQYNEVSGTRTNGTDGQGFDVDLAARGTVVQYNYSHDNEGGFLLMMGGTPSSDTVVRHNLSVNDGWGGVKGIFTFSYGVQENTQIYNNTVVIPSGSPAKPMFCDGCDGTTPGTWSFRNNIVHNLGSGDYLYPNVAGAVFDYNVFSGNHPAGEPTDAHKLTSSPQFVALPGSAPNGIGSVSGYQIASTSPAKGSGTVIAGNGGIDYFNRAVSATAAPSRGFHEALAVSGPRTYVDEGSSTDWLGVSARSTNARLDGTAPANFGGDAGRYARWDDNPGHVTWVFNGMTGFSATVYQFWSNSSFVSFSTSPDGVTWTPVATTTSASTPTAAGYSRVTITPTAALPAGTVYLKASFATSTGWAAQIGRIAITK